MNDKKQSGVVIQSGGGNVDVSGSALAGEGGEASVVTHNADLAEQFKALQETVGAFVSERQIPNAELQPLKDALADLKTTIEKKEDESEFQTRSRELRDLAEGIGLGAEAVGRIVKGLGGIAKALGWTLPFV